MVYDLGGGTFDVALVSIQDGEMKVIDHEGNNFLGGTDFDKEIVEQLVMPFLQHEGNFKNLETELKSASGKYNKLYNVLLNKAEEAKIDKKTALYEELEQKVQELKAQVAETYTDGWQKMVAGEISKNKGRESGMMYM